MTTSPSGTARTVVLAALAAAGIAAVMLVENAASGPLDALLLRLPGIDKVLHCVQSFAVFHVAWFLIGRTGLPTIWRAAATALATLAVAGADEIQQLWQGGRTVELQDIVASAGGMLFGLASVSAVRMPRLAAAAAFAAALVTGLVTHSSYVWTRDYNRGLVLESQGRMQDARLAYWRAYDSGVRHAQLYNALAWTMAESGEGDPAQAVRFAEQSLAMSPGSSDVLDTYGWTLYHAGRADDALAPLLKALELNPSIYCIHYHLGAVYLKQGNVDAARRHLRAQVAQAPRSKEAGLAAEMLGRIAEGGGRGGQ